MSSDLGERRRAGEHEPVALVQVAAHDDGHVCRVGQLMGRRRVADQPTVHDRPEHDGRGDAWSPDPVRQTPEHGLLGGEDVLGVRTQNIVHGTRTELVEDEVGGPLGLLRRQDVFAGATLEDRPADEVGRLGRPEEDTQTHGACGLPGRP
ncbi:MAG: hypothetical protein U5R31_09035 [Acidimicrobiia bacterium]|nr:hypothetical protein [Acidimicrobiia bacterium]